MGEAVVKVGKTNRSIDERIRELNGATSNLGRFEPLAIFPVSDIHRAEAECHQMLAKFREQRNREFFNGNIAEIVTIVEAVCQKYAPTTYIARDIRDGSENKAEKPVLSLLERIAAEKNAEQVQKAKREENDFRFDQLVSKLVDETRAILRRFESEFSENSCVLLSISDGPPMLMKNSRYSIDLLVGDLPYLRKAESLLPVAEIRVFAKNDNQQNILIGTESLGSLSEPTQPLLVSDDGRIFDLLIFPIAITQEIREELRSEGRAPTTDQDVGLLLVMNGFEYTSGTATFGESNGFCEPEYSYSELEHSEIWFEPLECVDRFIQVVAQNLVKSTIARLVEINEKGLQRVQKVFKPTMRPHYGLTEA